MKNYFKKNVLDFPTKNYLEHIMKDFLSDADSMLSFFKEKGVIQYPKLDMKEDAKNIYVLLEVPGIEKEDLDIHVNDQILTISGEKIYKCSICHKNDCSKDDKASEKTTSKKDSECCADHKLTSHYSEMQYGFFKRQLSLPSSVDVNSVKATYSNGILRIEMKKINEYQVKKIKID